MLQNVPEGGSNGKRLTDDVQIIERMEADLVKKAKIAFGKYALGDYIFGVFSLDDLEAKSRGDLCGKIAIGVGYSQTLPVATETTARAGALAVAGGPGAKSLAYEMAIILAVPTSEQCDERHNATTALTALRREILGSTIAGDISNRKWDFVSEAPQVAASSNTMLYYTQVWRVAIQCVGISN